MASHQQDSEIAWGLIMLLGGRRFEETVTAYVIAHEESICAGEVAADETVALSSPESDQRLEARAKIVAPVPVPRRLIGHDQRQRRTQRRVVFDHDDAGICHLDRFPDPIVIAVNIDAKQVNFAGHFRLFEQGIDVLGGDEIFDKLELAFMEKRDEILANVRDVRRRRFNPQSAPALDQQFGRVAFIASVNTELDKGFSCCADAPEDLLY
jgi:hypothetical protein